MLGAIARRCGDFAAAEDAVQEALLSAVAQWPEPGIPSNPGGWLFHVAWRRLADARRSERSRPRREEIVAAATPELAPEGASEPVKLEDDTLALFFMCCHPALTDASATALTLRAVGGLTTAEIAAAFLVPEVTTAQRISRAKKTIQETGAAFELSSEAIRLARALRRAKPGEPEVDGLLARMLLTDALRRARTGPRGELIALDEQDRTLWVRAQIADGSALITAAFGLSAAGAGGTVGYYQLQAAIAALHDEAPSVDSTDRPQILALYELPRRMSDNPMVALNQVQVVAAAMVQGPAEVLRRIEAVAADPRIAGRYRLDPVRGHLHERAGDRAAAATRSLPERNYLLLKAARLEAR